MTKPNLTKLGNEDIRLISDLLHYEHYIHEDADVIEFLSLCDAQFVDSLLASAHMPYPSLDDVPNVDELFNR